MTGIATLSNENNYTILKYGSHTIRFAAPYSLEYYTEVKEWDKGYLVVMAKYKHNQKPPGLAPMCLQKYPGMNLL